MNLIFFVIIEHIHQKFFKINSEKTTTEQLNCQSQKKKKKLYHIQQMRKLHFKNSGSEYRKPNHKLRFLNPKVEIK